MGLRNLVKFGEFPFLQKLSMSSEAAENIRTPEKAGQKWILKKRCAAKKQFILKSSKA